MQKLAFFCTQSAIYCSFKTVAHLLNIWHLLCQFACNNHTLNPRRAMLLEHACIAYAIPQHGLHCSPQVQLQTVRISVQQSSPTYHRGSAALTQLATDCSTLLDQCTAEADTCLAAVDLAGSQPKVDILLDSSALLVERGKLSRVEVIVEGLQLKVDDSEASCSLLSYSGATASVSVKNARANIVFKVCIVILSSRPNRKARSTTRPNPAQSMIPINSASQEPSSSGPFLQLLGSLMHMTAVYSCIHTIDVNPILY